MVQLVQVYQQFMIHYTKSSRSIQHNMHSPSKILKVGVLLLLLVNIFLLLIQHKYSCHEEAPLWEQTIDFSKTSFSNETGTVSGVYLVPNYVHFIRFNQPVISYVQMICILAAFKNQKPDKIFFHRNFNSSFKGKYWDVLVNTKGFLDVVVLNYVPVPEEIFGQPLSPSNDYSKYHAADIVRIQMLMKYGGIILDHDTYVVQSLNGFRRFEMTVNWDEGQFLGCQILIGHKDARFLKLYLESYHNYRSDLWYYNAGERPTKEILYKMPELVHRVKVRFGLDNKFLYDLFQSKWPEWRQFYSIHLLIRHQNNLKKQIGVNATYPVDFNEDNIVYYPVAFREMAYDVYDTAGVSWKKLEYN